MGQRFKRGDIQSTNNDKPKNNNGNGNNGKLTLKQWKFALEYVKDGNATQAVIRAGYSPKGADVCGVRLLGNIRVKESIEQRKKELLAAAQVTPARIIEEYKKLAFTNLPDFVDYKKQTAKDTYIISIEDFKSLTPDQRACLSGIEETRDGVKIKLYDKTKALADLARINAMFTDKVETIMSDDEVIAYAIKAGKDPQVFLEKWKANRGK